MSDKTRTHSLAALVTAALTLTLGAVIIAAAAWLLHAKEATRVTTPPPANATTAAKTTAKASAPVTPAAAQPAAAQPASAQPAVNAIANASASANTTATAAQPAPQPPAAPSTAGQRAFIDPVTGQLRQPEHDELAAIAAAAAAAAPARRQASTASTAPELFGPDGSISAVVPEDLHTFTVATRGADGRIVIEHAQGANNAARLIKANSAKKSPQASVSRAQQKEDRNDR